MFSATILLREKMNNLYTLFQAFLPWLLFIALVLLCINMIRWAKKRKMGAIAFGLLVQILIPDPKAQITIEAVVERKQEVKKQQQENGEPPADEIDKKGEGQ